MLRLWSGQVIPGLHVLVGLKVVFSLQVEEGL